MNPAPACRHLHTDGRPCGSPALRGEPFCFHHHTARKPMPRRADHTAPADLHAPQLPAPDDFPAIQRGLGEVLRLLANGLLADTRAQSLFKGLAIASQNLARHHRREEKLAALGLLQPAVTAYVNDPVHGTLAPEPPNRTEAPNHTEVLTTDNSPLTTPHLPATENLSLTTQPLPDPIPLLTPDPSPATSYDQAKTIEINHYFQTIDDKRRERSRLWAQQFEIDKSHEL